MTNIDEIEIEQAFRTRIDLKEREKKYAEVEWVALDDRNAGNYSQNIRFDTTELKDRYPVYRESYVAFPLKITSSNTDYTAATKLAFKCSVLSLVRSLSVRPAGSGPSLVNEIDGQLPLMNNLKLLTTSDIDWVECSGQELHFFGCDRYVAQNVMGTGVAGTASPSHVSITIPETDVYTNPRLADRVAVFTAQSQKANTNKTIEMIVSIPLKFLHSCFDQMSFPLPNYPMKIEFGLSSLTNGQEDFMPIVAPQGSVVGKFDVAGAPQVQAAVSAVDASSLAIDPNISIKGYSLGACRMFVKCVVLGGKDAEQMDAALSAGYKKTITYLVTDIHKQAAQTTSTTGQPYHRVFGENTKRPVRLWALFPPEDALIDEESLFPGTVGPCYIQDCSLKINGSQLRRTNWMNQLELYNELRQYQLGSGYRTQQGAPISYNDFLHGARPYLFDLSRHPTVLNNLPITFTFDAKLVDPAAGKVDPIFLVERYQTAFINISKSKITDSQLQTLLAGDKIPLEKRQFSGDVPLPLTKAQVKLIATASRGINLRLAGPARKLVQAGEGFVDDILKPVAKAALPFARKGVDWALDKLQSKLPTGKLGQFQNIADTGVSLGRKGLDWGLDKVQDKIKKMFRGAAGRKAIDAQLGEGWFNEYLLPGLETAAKIAMPLIRGGGDKRLWHHAIDTQMGAGWFTDYLLPGLETAAKIATPLIRGRGTWEPMTQQKVTSAKGLVL